MKTEQQRNPEDTNAQFERGLLALSRPGTANARDAVRWFKRAASAGHVDALLNLGCHLRDGRGARRDAQMARRCFEAAARKGKREAMTCLGRLLLEKGRTSADRKNGLSWLRKAIAKGDWSAAHFLGRAAEDTGNWRTAGFWYWRALENGDLVSGMRLAKHYLDHLNERFHPVGISVLRFAIRRSKIDPSWGYTELARCYLHGRGVRRSRKQAVKYLKLAADGDPEAQHLLKVLKP